MTLPDSVDLLRKDHSMLAATVGRHTDDLTAVWKKIVELEMQSAVRDERDKAVAAHLARIDNTLIGIQALGRWFLFAFCSSLIGAFVLFLVNGGLKV